MAKKRANFEKIKNIHKKLKEKEIKTKYEFEQLIYHDGKQYSCKLSSKLMSYVEYKKGDKLKFIVDISNKGEPKINIQYIHKK